MRIRSARPEDAEALLTIYAPYVEKTAITFEYEVPSIQDFARRITETLKSFPYLVLEDGGEIRGYAYAGTFKGRAAYDWAVETTVYIRQNAHGKGYGKALYTALEDELKRRHFLNAYACIAYSETEDETLTHASPLFHEHMGYTLSGTFRKCGCKFGRWYDMIWMEKHLGDHPSDPLPVQRA
ncbi:MAG: GNAT family N-acetyltransferase [Clostridia bacterium]|nr:GNAT family N-acetyltransferase [Clostridia bacterium]